MRTQKVADSFKLCGLDSEYLEMRQNIRAYPIVEALSWRCICQVRLYEGRNIRKNGFTIFIVLWISFYFPIASFITLEHWGSRLARKSIT